MNVRTAHPAEHHELVALMESALRPEGGETRVVDDFPVALGRENGQGLLVMAQEGGIAAGLACLVRPFRTSLGRVTVAAIGSVVTHPQMRGRGFSSRLQTTTLARLKDQGVALAVLWSAHPEWYAGRGFEWAGVEYHVDLTPWRPLDGISERYILRPFHPNDEPAVSRLYGDHPYITLRQPNDAKLLYSMPGTRGWLAMDAGGEVVAYVFCGKGADFTGYVLEWGGGWAPLQDLLTKVRSRGLANRILVPQGAGKVRDRLCQQGAVSQTVSSGLWCVVSPECLREQTANPPSSLDLLTGDNCSHASNWLGSVSQNGHVQPGPVELAVWGFDSV